MFNCQTVEEARKKRNSIIEDNQDVAEAAMSCLDEGFADAMTVMALPKTLRLYFRTSNPIERINCELKRRSRVIGIFPNAESLLRLMGSVLIELNDTAQTRKSFFTTDTYQEMLLSGTPAKLHVIAIEQHQQLAA